MTQEQNAVPVATVSRMVLLGLVLVSPSFLYGLSLAYPTVALPKMDWNVDHASWFGSVAVYVSPISSMMTGLIIDTFGRRAAILTSILPSIAGWSLLYCSEEVLYKLAGQMLNGLTVGAVFYPVQVYVGESIMADSIRLRNSFLSWIGFSSSLGTTLMLSLANIFDYRQICVICLAICICLFLVFSLVIPESPAWLYRQGRIHEAKLAEKKLGIRQPILYQCPAPTDCHSVSGSKSSDLSWSNLKASLKKIKRRDVYKPLMVLCGTGLLLPFSGMLTCNTYMIDIISGHVPGYKVTSDLEATPTSKAPQVEGDGVAAVLKNATSETVKPHMAPTIDANKYSIICGLCMCAGSLLSSLIIPRLGMRRLIIASVLGSNVGLYILAAAYYMEPSPTVFFVRIAAVSLLAFLLGSILGPICACSGDIFPADAKGFACVSDICSNFSGASANKLYPYLCLVLGGFTYCLYAAIGFCGAIFVYFFAPEVVGLTLEEINLKFSKK